MTHALATGILGGLVIGCLLWIWDDLVSVRRDRVAADFRAPFIHENIQAGYSSRPGIATLVSVSPIELVTPRGVEIPADWLQDDLDLGDALDWLDYVESLG
jgi:hypothetical protein